MLRFVWVVSFLLLPAFAQDEPRKDAEGCKDSSYVSRFPGSFINSCNHREFDSYSMPVSKDAEGNGVEKAIEGEYWDYDIATRDGISPIQIYRNFHNALAAAGWKFLYEESPSRFTAQKGDVYLDLQSSGSYYYLFTVKKQAMQQEVSADATQMATDIDKSGHVAVYGIEFETGKSAILPASEPVLQQVQKLLEDHADLKIRIEGHTDNTGDAGGEPAAIAEAGAGCDGMAGRAGHRRGAAWGAGVRGYEAACGQWDGRGAGEEPACGTGEAVAVRAGEGWRAKARCRLNACPTRLGG